MSLAEPEVGGGSRQASVGSAVGAVLTQLPVEEGQISPKSDRVSAVSPPTGSEKTNEYLGEADDFTPACECDPKYPDCECATPPNEEDAASQKKVSAAEEAGDSFQLDEFMRAKSYFLQTSSKSGLNLYDHLSDVIRKFLDERAPTNPVDYLEEVSMNVKRYRFGVGKKDALQEAFYISEPVLSDAKKTISQFKTLAKWSQKDTDAREGSFAGGSFQNLLRLQYYLEQVNLGLPREEMFRLAIGIKEMAEARPQISRLRFWGKIFALQKNYYIIEAELKFGGSDQAPDLWVPGDDGTGVGDSGENDGEGGAGGGAQEQVMDALQTFSRAKNVVLNHEVLAAYSKTSGLPTEKQGDLLPKPVSYFMPGPGKIEWDGEGGGGNIDPDNNLIEFEDPDARADANKWESYQQELMENFPQVSQPETVPVPIEPDGSGVNRRVFYVCNNLGEDWVLLPAVTPAQINASRAIRWYLTGNLNSPVKSIPPFPGKEGHFLKALLARITAGAMVSPKGFYKTKSSDEMAGEDDDELEPEDDDVPVGDDTVQPVKKLQISMKALTNKSLAIWVHHTACILPQGRIVWWNPAPSKKKKPTPEDDSEADYDEEDEDEEDDELVSASIGRESGPPLFRSIAEDIGSDGRAPWSLITSSTIFTEFQVVSVRSNVWSGSNVICTSKGKVSNIYLGDGLKFAPITFAPAICEPGRNEFRAGPELQEIADPTVEEEQSWLAKLAREEIADKEAKLADNEDGELTGDEEDEFDN